MQHQMTIDGKGGGGGGGGGGWQKGAHFLSCQTSFVGIFGAKRRAFHSISRFQRRF